MEMRVVKTIILCAGLLGLGGCSTELGPSQAELRAQWDAQNVLPQNYKSDLLAFLRTYLNNPEKVHAAVVAPPALKKVGQGERYVVCVRYNARDTDGKYMGPKEGAAVFVSARLENFIDQPREAKELCKDAVYAPFPELEALRR
jgi:hypothetical protein